MSEKLCECSLAELDKVLGEAGGEEGALISILQKAQDIFGHLPKEVLMRISERTGVPISRIYGVVTFYTQFHLEARGRNIIRSCQGTACHVRGASEVLAAIRDHIGLKEGESTTSDLRYTLETVACIGCCGLAPVIMANDDTHGRLDPSNVSAILDKYE